MAQMLGFDKYMFNEVERDKSICQSSMKVVKKTHFKKKRLTNANARILIVTIVFRFTLFTYAWSGKLLMYFTHFGGSCMVAIAYIPHMLQSDRLEKGFSKKCRSRQRVLDPKCNQMTNYCERVSLVLSEMR